jgi:hypothetical protein
MVEPITKSLQIETGTQMANLLWWLLLRDITLALTTEFTVLKRADRIACQCGN